MANSSTQTAIKQTEQNSGSTPAGETSASQQPEPSRPLFQPSDLKYLLLGILFGIFLIKSEVIAWYRIQEMFRFQSFHMYGVIGSAIVVGAIALALLKHFKVKSLDGKRISVAPKKFHWGNVYGGVIFGLGWAMTGACPGPIFAHLGAGTASFVIVILSGLLGTWVYSYFRPKLPH